MVTKAENNFIKYIRLKNFLSYGPKGVELKLHPLNVFIGPNAAGKSNLIEALRIIRAAAQTDPEKDIGNIIRNHFGRLMNNRIGTFLKKDIETSNIRDTTGKFSHGEMVIQTIDNDTYKWCMITSDVDSDGNINVIDRVNPISLDFESKLIPKNNLKQYSQSEKIEQNLVGSNAIFNETNLMETYTIY